MTTDQLPCIPGYTWDDVAWLGNDGYPNYYVTRDYRVYNDKTGVWVKLDTCGSATLAYETNKFRHVNIRKMVVKYFVIPDMLKQGYVSILNGTALINREGRVYNTILCKEAEPYIMTSGYLAVSCNKANYLLHRLLAQTFIPNPEPLVRDTVNHKDGNKLNNSLDNLEWVTQQENLRHASLTGALKFAKLTFDDAQEIRRLYTDKHLTVKELAEMYGVSRTGITNVIEGISWDYSDDYKDATSSKWAKRLESLNGIERVPMPEEVRKHNEEHQTKIVESPPITVRLTVQELKDRGFVSFADDVLFVNDQGQVYDINLGRLRTAPSNPEDTRIKYHGRRCSISRAVAENFVPNDDPNSKTLVHHLNGDPLDNRAANLMWISPVQKAVYSVEHGRSGDKLNLDKANEIRDLYSNQNISIRELSRRYGVSRDIINSIVMNTIWVDRR